MLPPARNITTILLIDEKAAHYKLFSKALQEVAPGAKLYYACCCQDIEQVISGTRPDIIFIDCDIPGSDCFAKLEAFMSYPIFKTIPVVLHSACQNPALIAMAYSFGASLFFKKPQRYDVLVMGLRKVLEMEWAPQGGPFKNSQGFHTPGDTALA